MTIIMKIFSNKINVKLCTFYKYNSVIKLVIIYIIYDGRKHGYKISEMNMINILL